MYAQSWEWSNSNELYHFQRLGAHWGQRNGPPYPLDRAAVDAGYDGKQAKLYESNKQATDNYKSAKKQYKAAKQARKASKAKLNEARYEQSTARTKESYKKAKLSVKAEKAMSKASKITLSEAKKNLKMAKAELKAQKALEKIAKKEAKTEKRADKAFENDLQVVKSRYSKKTEVPSNKIIDQFTYRHESITSDKAYADRYNKRVEEAMKQLKAEGWRDELIKEAERSLRLKYKAG